MYAYINIYLNMCIHIYQSHSGAKHSGKLIFVYMYIYMYIYKYINIYICTYKYVQVYMYI